MKRAYLLSIALLFLILDADYCDAASWQKLYVKKSTDCFRCVKEVSSGGYILAGYTANLTPNDTDALAVRLDVNGDTLWTFVYNGPSGKEDCFYKVVPTSDNGFVFCGYSRSFSSSDNVFYLKLNSSGHVQWVKNWGGSGIDRGEDMIELDDGNFIICGYSTSSPARYYDAFILKIDPGGNTVWTKIYGGTSYDDANSVIELPDHGLLVGGQSNNQLFLIRTNSDGDSLWTRSFGTSGIDNIKCVNFAQGGDGFVLAGTTDGAGSGGEDAYLVRTDTGGVQLWAKTYGGSLNDGFHTIEQTSDGGYFACGTSSEGPWNNPNICITKLDANGNKSWENFFGGENHDHGYSGTPTSDGGYIASGHTRSFANTDNIEDALVIKTNSSGQVSNYLSWTEVTDLISPVSGGCGNANAEVIVELTNWSVQSVSSIPVTVEITGAINQTFSQTLNSSVAHNGSKNLTFTTHVNMSAGGTYNFHIYTGNPNDVYPSNNYLDKAIVVNTTSQPPTVTDDSRCGPGTITLSASSPDQIKWYSSSSGGSSLQTGPDFTTPYLTSSTTYYAQAGTSCPSTRVAADATITPGLTVPTPNDGSRCGNGTVLLSGTSTYPIKWYSSSTSTSALATGATYTTNSLSSNTNFYIAADNGTCTSNRATVHAVIDPIPNEPVITPGFTCGSGTVALSASASDPVKWYTSSSGGSPVGSGNNFTTPVISTTTTYYALADDGTCQSDRVAAVATVEVIPSPPVTTSDDRCGEGTIVLTATSSDPVKWFDSATGGSQVGSGNSFTTPAISSTTTFFALTDNGPCRSSRIPAVATINPLPALPVLSATEICGAGTATLTATSSDPVEWFDADAAGNQLGSGNNFITPVISSNTTYYAQTDNGLCESDRVSLTVNVNALPVVDLGPDTIFTSTSSYLLDAGSGFNSYEWNPIGASQTFTANSSGNYCVTVTDANDCQATSCVFVELSVGIDQVESKNGIKIYPVPVKGILTVEQADNVSGNYLNVIDITGKTVFCKPLNNSKETFDLSFLSRGIYVLRVKDENTSSAYRLVIE